MALALRSVVLLLLAALALAPRPSFAQEAKDDTVADDAGKPPMSQPELDQLVAAIALYPDPLLAQMLMASTSPIEVVQADRWLKQNEGLQGDALAKALEAKPWDASVKSLVNFPDVLAMMSEELEWTVKLGDAFLGQQKQVMETIQTLRRKAKAKGSLQSGPEQTVTVEDAGPTQIIEIEPTNPEVIYVPAYDPWVAYGVWGYPDYGPYYYPMPWYWGGAGLYFGSGFAVGLPWGYAWGHPHWHHHHVDIDHRRNAHRNRHVEHRRYSPSPAVDGSKRIWHHSPSHRAGMSYRNRATAERVDGRWRGSATQARDSFRARAEQGRRAISAGSVPRSQVPRSQTARPVRAGPVWTPRSTGGTAGPRRPSFSSPRAYGDGSRPSEVVRRGATFRNVDRGWMPTRASSQRGHSSRFQSAPVTPRYQGVTRGGGSFRHAPVGGSSFRGARPGGSSSRSVRPGGSFRGGARPGGGSFRAAPRSSGGGRRR